MNYMFCFMQAHGGFLAMPFHFTNSSINWSDHVGSNIETRFGGICEVNLCIFYSQSQAEAAEEQEKLEREAERQSEMESMESPQ